MLYDKEQVRQILGDISDSQLSKFQRMGLICPIRQRPSLYTEDEVLNATERIQEYHRKQREKRRLINQTIKNISR